MWERQDRRLVWIQAWKYSETGVELIFVVDDFGDLRALMNHRHDALKYSLFSNEKEF